MATSDYLRGARVVVIGAGAVGSAVSYRLAQAGAVVNVIERRFPGAGTTGRSFAYLNGNNKPPQSYHRLNVMSIRDHEDLADEIGGDWVHVNGSLHWAAASEPARLDNLRGIMRQLLDWGMRVDVLDPGLVMREVEPDLRIDVDDVPAVYFVQRAGWLDCVAMAYGTTLAAVRRYNARLVQKSVVAFGMKDELIESVTLDDGSSLLVDVVINAAGPDAGHIADLGRTVLPLERSPGILITTSPAPVELRHVVYSPAGNVRPDGGNRLMIQRESLDEYAVEDHPLALDNRLVLDAVERITAIIPGLAATSVEATRVGVRPMPADGRPLIGFDPAVANLYHVVTHSGITLAARLALLVTEELTGGDTLPLEPYRLTRFPTASAVRGLPDGVSSE